MARKLQYEDAFYGSEPKLSADSGNVDVIRFYNWHNYNHTAEDAKRFVLNYLKQRKASKQVITRLSKVSENEFRTIGWNCRALSIDGSALPKDLEDATWDKINSLANSDVAKASTEDAKAPISAKERTEAKISSVISDLEGVVDDFIANPKHRFDAVAWMKSKEVKGAVGKAIAEYYEPIHAEVLEALEGNNPDLNEAYDHWTKTNLKKYAEYLGAIVSAANGSSAVVRIQRKPRKKKVKPVADIVKSMKFKATDEEYGLTSIDPTQVVGAQQLWVFNAKTRNLSVYYAQAGGLSVTGTTLTNFNEETSITKKLRKPEVTLKEVASLGKVPLKKVMDSLTCKPNVANGRLNIDTILLRAIK